MAAPNAEHRLFGLKKLREDLGIFQSDLERLSDLSRGTITTIDSEKTVKLSSIDAVIETLRDNYAERLEYVRRVPHEDDDKSFDLEYRKREANQAAEVIDWRSDLVALYRSAFQMTGRPKAERDIYLSELSHVYNDIRTRLA